MKLEQDVCGKIENAPTLLEKVKILLNEAHMSDVVYETKETDSSKVQDTALIQCFYGTDIRRIRATTQAIEFNLHMTSKPSSWVFVECQTKKSECAFTWLKKYGIKHVFVPMKANSKGIMLKNPLWNIGAMNCKDQKLCFVDSDVVLCNSDWVEKTAREFESGYDVLSLASHQYYQSDDSCKLYETIGYKWKNKSTVENGHCGFTLGITRGLFEKIGKFDPTLILADIDTFHKIIGDKYFKPFQKWWFPVNPETIKRGFNCQFGYVDNIACHVWHGDCESKYDDITTLLRNCGMKSMKDILDCLDNCKLPTWNISTSRNMAIKNVMLRYQKYMSLDEESKKDKTFDMIGEYYSELANLSGKIDAVHPLIVCTVVEDGFNARLQNFVDFKERVEKEFSHSKLKPKVLFFTDCQDLDFASVEVNTIFVQGGFSEKDYIEFIMENEQIYPKNALLYYIPFDLQKFNVKLGIPSEKMEFYDGTILIPTSTNTSIQNNKKSRKLMKLISK